MGGPAVLKLSERPRGAPGAEAPMGGPAVLRLFPEGVAQDGGVPRAVLPTQVKARLVRCVFMCLDA